jgi:hypothetical protein
MATNPHWLKANAPDLPLIIKLKEHISERSKREYFLACIAALEGRIPKDLESLFGEDTPSDSAMIVQPPRF